MGHFHSTPHSLPCWDAAAPSPSCLPAARVADGFCRCQCQPLAMSTELMLSAVGGLLLLPSAATLLSWWGRGTFPLSAGPSRGKESSLHGQSLPSELGASGRPWRWQCDGNLTCPRRAISQLLIAPRSGWEMLTCVLHDLISCVEIKWGWILGVQSCVLRRSEPSAALAQDNQHPLGQFLAPAGELAQPRHHSPSGLWKQTH